MILIAFQGQSQSYTVIHTIGKIYDTQSGTYLSKGSKVSENATLKFETDGAKAAVLSSSRGRFVIQQNGTSSSQSDAAYVLTSVISPVRGRLSTRAGSINNTLDFQKHFNEGSIALLGRSYRVTVSSTGFPMTESRFFYVQYEYEGETINKKLSSDEDNLVINLNNFFSIDGNAIDPSAISDARLHYYDASKGSSKFITDMDITYVSDEILRSMLDQFEEDKETAVLEIINSMYGKCSEDQLKEAISQL